MRFASALLATTALLAVLALAGCGSAPRRNTADNGTFADIECVPYARQASGIQLYGDAAAWWDQAAGRYVRAEQPQPGAVLVFRRTERLPHGHVSVVTQVASAREIVVTQANWVHGRIARAEPVVDVSPDGDWSAVRVWWAPSGQMGATVYPTFGFVGPGPEMDQVASAQWRISDAPVPTSQP